MSSAENAQFWKKMSSEATKVDKYNPNPNHNKLLTD